MRTLTTFTIPPVSLRSYDRRRTKKTVRMFLLVTAFLVAPSFTASIGAQSGESVGSAAEPDQLIIRPGDILKVRVWPAPELGGEFLVEETGLVYLPSLGAVRAGGIPLRDLRHELRQRYGEVMKMPVVTVTPLFRVYVLGSVAQPGLYEVDPTVTLVDVIYLAGGLAPETELETVKVIRKEQTVVVDMKRALESAEDMTLMHLQSGDKILVVRKGRPLMGRILSLQTGYRLLQVLVSVATIVALLR